MKPSGPHTPDSDSASLAVRKMMDVSPGPQASDQRVSKRPHGSDSAPTSDRTTQAKDNPSKTTLRGFVSPLDQCGHALSWLQDHRRWALVALLAVFALMRPGLAVGLILVVVIVVASMRIALGAEIFWRRVLAFHAVVETHRPGFARTIKLRVFVLSRKWQRLLDRLPEAISDPLRPPNLPALLAADARHDAVLAARLNQLRQDGVR